MTLSRRITLLPLLLLGGILVPSGTVYAQTVATAGVSVSGSITNGSGELLIGATVKVVGRRTGVLVECIRDHAANDNLANFARERTEDKHVNWVIPETELDLLAPNYPQNEGY